MGHLPRMPSPHSARPWGYRPSWGLTYQALARVGPPAGGASLLKQNPSLHGHRLPSKGARYSGRICMSPGQWWAWQTMRWQGRQLQTGARAPPWNASAQCGASPPTLPPRELWGREPLGQAPQCPHRHTARSDLAPSWNLTRKALGSGDGS